MMSIQWVSLRTTSYKVIGINILTTLIVVIRMEEVMLQECSQVILKNQQMIININVVPET